MQVLVQHHDGVQLEFAGSLQPTGLQIKTVAGLRVYGPGRLEEAVIRHDVAQIVVAIPSTSAAQERRLIERIEVAGLPVKILPGLVEMVDRRAAVADASWPR